MRKSVSHGRVQVLQVGPTTSMVGGMASVIEELCNLPTERYHLTPVASYFPQSRLRSALSPMTILVKLMCDREIAIVHAHMSENFSVVREGIALWLARALGRRTVLTIHGARFTNFTRRHRLVSRLALRSASLILCLGPAHLLVAQGLAPKVRQEIIYNPVSVDLPKIPTIASKQVLFAGEIGTRKGFDRLAAAWPRVSATIPDATLVVAGPNKYPGPLPKLPRTTYLGLLSREQVLAAVNKSTLVCLPSRDEVLPMILLEAATLGVRTLSTEVGEYTQIASSPGASTISTETAESPAELSRTITQILRSDDSEALRGATRAWARANTSSAAVATKLFALYDELLEGATAYA